MTQPDKQLVAFAGKPTGEIILVDWRQPEGQTHRILRKDGDLTYLTHTLAGVIDGEGYHDALKVSGCVNLQVIAGTVRGGSEDVVDINHSDTCRVSIQEALPTGRYVATIKGGSKNIQLVVAKQIGHGRETDYDLGNWSDQGHERTTNVTIGVWSTNSEPIKVRVLHAHRPETFGCRFEVSVRYKGVFHWFMDLLKRLNWA